MHGTPEHTAHSGSILDTLTPTQRLFAMARARGQSVAESAQLAHVHRGTPATKWDMNLINAAILEIQATMAANAIEALAPLLPVALAQLEAMIKQGRFEAVQEVFNRIWGKPVQRQELAGNGGKPLNVQVSYVSCELSDNELLAIIARGD